MSSFFDDLEAQLTSAARTRAGASAPARHDALRRRRRRREWLRATPVLAATLIALAVVGAALVLLGHRGPGATSGSRPPSGGIGALIAHTPQKELRRELAYIAAATRGVENSKPCRLQPRVTYIGGSPGSDLLSILGVLRRPASPGDRLNPQMLEPTPDVYRSYIRRAYFAGGVSYYIVPSRFDPAASIPSHRCFELQTTALDRYLPKIPAPLRQPTREIQAAIFAYLRSTARQTPRDRICLVYVGIGSGSACGTTPKGIEEGFATENALGTPNGTFSGVVPDGVATVTVIFPATGQRPAHAVTSRVEANVYAVHVPIYALNSLPPSPTVIWHSPQGRVLKRFPPLNVAELRALLCKQQPIACLLLETATVTSSSSSGSGASIVSRQRASAGSKG